MDLFCTAFDKLASSSDADLKLMADLIQKNCLTSIVTNPKRTVTIIVPDSAYLKELASGKGGHHGSVKESLRAHILRRARPPAELEKQKSIKSNNGIEFVVKGLEIDGVKLKHVPGATATLKSKKGDYSHGEVYKASGALKTKRGGRRGRKIRGGGSGEFFDEVGAFDDMGSDNVIRYDQMNEFVGGETSEDSSSLYFSGGALRSAIVRAYESKFPPLQAYGSYYAYPRWLSAALGMYLKDTIPGFLHSHRQFHSYSSPLASMELLLQPRCSTGPYVVSDEILRGFCKSDYFLCDRPSLLTKYKLLSAYGGSAPYIQTGGAPSPGTLDVPQTGGYLPGVFHTNPDAIYSVVRDYRDVALDIAGRWRGSPARLLDALQERVYSPLYSKAIIAPNAMAVLRSQNKDAAMVALHNDLVRVMSNLYGKLPNYEAIMDAYFAKDVKSNLEAIKIAMEATKNSTVGALSEADLKNAILKGVMLFNAIVTRPEDTALAYHNRIEDELRKVRENMALSIPTRVPPGLLSTSFGGQWL